MGLNKLGNILVTLITVDDNDEKFVLLNGKDDLANFLDNYDSEQYLIVDINILGDSVESLGVEEPTNFLKDTGLELGN